MGFTDVSGWDFAGQDLSDTNFMGAKLDSANLSGAIVHGADFSSTTPVAFRASQLYSTASYQARDLSRIRLENNAMQFWNFAGQNLTNASFVGAWLTNADFNGANVRGADFAVTTSRGFTEVQLYSTANYQARDLTGLRLDYDELSGWNFAGQNLSNASLYGATMTGAEFSSADMRGAQGVELNGALTTSLIHPNGKVLRLDLADGDVFLIRDYDGDADRQPDPLPPIPIHIEDEMSLSPDSTLRLIFETDPWDSTISFEPDIPVQLGGTLELTFADEVDVATQIGRTFHVFDWTGVEPTGAFAFASGYPWDVSGLYTTGEVTLLLPGDTNGDQVVDVNDLNNVRNNFGGAGPGDTNDDRTIDLVDLNNVRNFFGVSAAQAVPEPSGRSLAAIVASLAACGAIFRRFQST